MNELRLFAEVTLHNGISLDQIEAPLSAFSAATAAEDFATLVADDAVELCGRTLYLSVPFQGIAADNASVRAFAVALAQFAEAGELSVKDFDNGVSTPYALH